MIMCYSRTIPIQNIVLPPTSISYLRTKPSLPSSPIRSTARLDRAAVSDWQRHDMCGYEPLPNLSHRPERTHASET